MTSEHRHRADRPPPEFDKGTLARTPIGLYGPGHKPARSAESLRVPAPCQIPAHSPPSPRIRAPREERHSTRLRSPSDAGKADIACRLKDGPSPPVTGC